MNLPARIFSIAAATLLVATITSPAAVSILRAPGVFEASWTIDFDNGRLGEVGPGLFLSSEIRRPSQSSWGAVIIRLQSTQPATEYYFVLGTEIGSPSDVIPIGLTFAATSPVPVDEGGTLPLGYAVKPVLSFSNPGNGGPIISKLTVGQLTQQGQPLPKGTILQLSSGSPAPSGFKRIGSVDTHLRDPSGHPMKATWIVYEKQ